MQDYHSFLSYKHARLPQLLELQTCKIITASWATNMQDYHSFLSYKHARLSQLLDNTLELGFNYI